MADKKTYTINEDLSLSESMTKTQIENKIKESVNNQAGIYKLSPKSPTPMYAGTDTATEVTIQLSDKVTNYDYLIIHVDGLSGRFDRKYIIEPNETSLAPNTNLRGHWTGGLFVLNNYDIGYSRRASSYVLLGITIFLNSDLTSLRITRDLGLKLPDLTKLDATYDEVTIDGVYGVKLY